jgi:hypothetical protein
MEVFSAAGLYGEMLTSQEKYNVSFSSAAARSAYLDRINERSFS